MIPKREEIIDALCGCATYSPENVNEILDAYVASQPLPFEMLADIWDDAFLGGPFHHPGEGLTEEQIPLIRERVKSIVEGYGYSTKIPEEEE